MSLLCPWYKLQLCHIWTTATVYFMVLPQSICRNYSTCKTQQPILWAMLKHGHISLLLFRLNWLPITFRIYFKIEKLAFKCIYGLAPQYLSSLLTVREYSRYNLQPSDGIVLVYPSIRTKKTLGDRPFSTAALKEWNNLPLHIRNDWRNFTKFKKSLKNYYFKIAYQLVTWTYFLLFDL